MPFFREPEAEEAELVGALPAGRLVERVTPMRLSAKDARALVEPQTFEASPGTPGPAATRPSGAARVWKGPLEEILPAPGQHAWTFKTALASADGVPTREALCRAFAAADPAQADRLTARCRAQGRFHLPDPAAPSLVAHVDETPEASRLALLDLTAIRGGGPAVRGAIVVGHVFSLRQVPMPGGRALLIVEEFVRHGALTGRQHALVVVDGGRLERIGELPAETSEPRAGVVTQRSSRLTIGADRDRPIVSAEVVEVEQSIRTGALGRRRTYTQVFRWDAASGRLAAAPLTSRKGAIR